MCARSKLGIAVRRWKKGFFKRICLPSSAEQISKTAVLFQLARKATITIKPPRGENLKKVRFLHSRSLRQGFRGIRSSDHCQGP